VQRNSEFIESKWF